jgi:hypothetical protein
MTAFPARKGKESARLKVNSDNSEQRLRASGEPEVAFLRMRNKHWTYGRCVPWVSKQGFEMFATEMANKCLLVWSFFLSSSGPLACNRRTVSFRSGPSNIIKSRLVGSYDNGETEMKPIKDFDLTSRCQALGADGADDRVRETT